MPNVHDLSAIPGMETVFLSGDGSTPFERGYTSDLLSDVMGRAPENSVLVTIQAHRNTIAVSAMAGVRAVVVCNRREIPEDMLELAMEEGISIFRTRENQFATTCRVQELLNGA